MDLGTLKRRVRQSASLTADDTQDVVDFINDAVRDFCRDAEVGARPFVFPLTDGVDTYDLAVLAAGVTPPAAGVIRFLSLTAGSTGERAQQVDIVDDLEELAWLRGGSSTAGLPRKAALVGFDTLVLYPAPGTGYELSGFLVPTPTALVLDTDVPAVPEQYHRAIYYRATQLAIEWDRQGDADADKFEARYMAQVGYARKQRTRLAGGRPRGLVPSSAPAQQTWPPYPFGSM